MSDSGSDPKGRKPHALDRLMTQTVHAGERGRASTIPLELSNSLDMTYARHSNVTAEAFEAKLADLEGGAGTVAMASGMAAVSQTLLALLKSGDRLLIHEHVFVGVRQLLYDYLPGLGIEIARTDMRDQEQLARSLETPTRAIYFETLSNPEIDVLNAPEVIRAGRDAGVLCIVDNTLLTPCAFRPIDHGAELVIHSASKYIGGHGDAIGGVVTASDASLADDLRKARRLFGGILSPMNAYTLAKGLKTLPIRFEHQCANALEVARFLDRHPRIHAVNYPGLESSPAYAVARRFLDRFGAMMSVVLGDGVDRQRFLDTLRLCRVGYSFGETGTTVLMQNWTPLLRICVGLEASTDIINDLNKALEAA